MVWTTLAFGRAGGRGVFGESDSEETEVAASGPIESVCEALVAGGFVERVNLRVEVDPDLLLRDGPVLRTLLRSLLRVAADTVPRGGEIYVAAARPGDALVRVGAARVVVRWQVGDPVAESEGGRIVGIRPDVRGAASIAASKTMIDLAKAFERIDWCVSVEPTPGGRELLAIAMYPCRP